MSVYSLTSGFSQEVWRRFAREKLELKDGVIEEAEGKWPNQFEEQRIQMLKVWMEGKTNSERSFIQHKHDFFCGQCWREGFEPIAASHDLADEVKAQDSNDNEYPDSGKGGCALIICNSFEDGGYFCSRKGAAENDAEKMEELWRNKLNCSLIDDKVHKNISAKDMKVLCERLARQKDCDYTALITSTHGGGVPLSWIKKYGPDSSETLLKLTSEEKGQRSKELLEEVLFGNDERLLKLADMKGTFGNERSKDLVHKPKLFIFQHCRGNLAAGGVFAGADHVDESQPGTLTEEDAHPGDTTQKANFFQDMLPEMSDVVVGYPTQASYKAYRNNEGSWFLTTVSEIFRDKWQHHDVVEMLTMVNGKMKRRNPGVIKDEYVKPMSVFESSLEKKFKLTRPKN